MIFRLVLKDSLAVKKVFSIFYRKKIDAITALLLFFIFFLLLLFGYLVKVYSDTQRYSTYDDSIIELKLIDKTFDNFLLQKSTFINYDDINKNILNFEEQMVFLDSKASYELFGVKYASLLAEIHKEYQNKYDYIELFKSENASFLNSMHYLFDLNNAIEEQQILDKKSIAITNETLHYLMMFYINSYIDTKKMQNNFDFLQQTLQKNDNIELKMFVRIALRNIEGIGQLVKVDEAVATPYLANAINKLHDFVNRSHEKDILIEKVIAVTQFVIAVIILFILLAMHRRSLSIKDELIGFKTAVENSDNSIVITDAKSNIIYVNEVFERDAGYSKEEAIGQNPRILKSGENSEAFYNKMHETLKRGEKWEGEFINKRKDGSLYYEKASITPIFVNGELVKYLAINLNITDYIEQKREVEFMAYHDALTSLPNRINIEEYLEHRLIVAKRQSSRVSILFIDLDRFKTINDTLGHDVGDELLIQSAKRMREALRESDMLARIGGDEFVIIVEALNEDYSAAHVAKKMLQLFTEPIITSNHRLNITLSIGIAIFPDDGVDCKTIFKHADVAMYKAKESGKNTYRYYKKQLSVDVHKRLAMEQAMKEALRDNEFYVVYQPKYTIDDKSVIGLEALVRWESLELGLISPVQFIPVAEDSGYILEIGKYVFRQACEDFLHFKQHCLTLHVVAINISAIQLYQENFVDEITAITKETGIDPSSIVLEITESHIMKNTKYSMSILSLLKELGFAISIDDFGTGHSSMSYLKQFPIDELKIDKSFVDELPHDQNDVAIAKAIIVLSQSLGYVNVAEGIENEAQEKFLADNGCLIGQGYHFCRPQKKEDLIIFLDESCT